MYAMHINDVKGDEKNIMTDEKSFFYRRKISFSCKS